MTGVLMRRGSLETDTHRWKTLEKHREKMAIYKPRERPSEGTNTTNTLILDSRPSELSVTEATRLVVLRCSSPSTLVYVPSVSKRIKGQYLIVK